jgi:two-component system, chemotaxis family, protein-glutamate methylesterase/glutaminase
MAVEQQEPVVVAIGASAGGVEALTELVAGLPRDFSCAVLVALHMPVGAISELARILDRSGPLPAKAAIDGAELEPGTICVAVPDRHLTLRDRRIVLSDDPAEHGHRPAIDALFRSVASSYGRRAIGVLLSGVLSDGVNGLAAIRSHGGTTVAQSPADAHFSDLPLGAIEAGIVDHEASAGKISELLAELAGDQLPELQQNSG